MSGGERAAAHTPGPWPTAVYDNQGVAERLPYKAWHEIDGIARVYGGDEKHGKANARLIAAAPDMLEALTALVGMVSCMMDERKCPEMAAARAALAKAEG